MKQKNEASVANTRAGTEILFNCMCTFYRILLGEQNGLFGNFSLENECPRHRIFFVDFYVDTDPPFVK